MTLDPDEQKIAELIAKLEHWWWSPRHPQFMLSKLDREHIAKGLFNVFWVLAGCCERAIPGTPENSVIIVKLQALMPELIDGYPVYEWATLLTPKEFYEKAVKPWKSPELEKIGDYSFWRNKFSVAG